MPIRSTKWRPKGTHAPAPARGRNETIRYYSRGYLPHVDGPGLIQSVTFRVIDSVPAECLERWGRELAGKEPEEVADGIRRRAEVMLDVAPATRHLDDPRLARLVCEALKFFDQKRYVLFAFVVMPSHVHVLFQVRPGLRLCDVVHSWKGFTTHEAIRLFGWEGSLWERDYFDRFVRDDRHFASVREYIENNPVKAGLVEAPSLWRWGSAFDADGEAALHDP